MSANTVYCHILKDNVTVVTNLNGDVTNIVCPEFWRFNHGCQKKTESLGFLGSIRQSYISQRVDRILFDCSSKVFDGCGQAFVSIPVPMIPALQIKLLRCGTIRIALTKASLIISRNLSLSFFEISSAISSWTIKRSDSFR